MKPKRVAIIIVAGLFLYLGLYTWNVRTGHLDVFSSYTGLDLTGTVIRPGRWVSEEVSSLWENYVNLVEVKRENDRLKGEIQQLILDNAYLREQAQATRRLENLLAFAELPGWSREGARVVAHRMGPSAVLDTILLDKGALGGVRLDTPVMIPEGLVGRVHEFGLSVCSVLLLGDPNSRVAVIGRQSRSMGVLFGQGTDRELELNYVNQNSPLIEGEILVTSGLDGIFPKGLPVARVLSVERSDISLFLTVQASPLVDACEVEEVLLLNKALPAEPVLEQ